MLPDGRERVCQAADSYALDNNVYWNGGAAIPSDSGELVNYSDDAHAIVADPLLGDPSGAVVPRWNPGDGQFDDGSASIAAAFERLVLLYGTPAQGSPAIDAANPAYSPNEDILGNSRPAGGPPDVGAVEFQPQLQLEGVPADGAISLSWTVNTTLPTSTTWHIDYYTQTASIYTATEPLSTTRSTVLTQNVQNYQWYTVTLHAMDGTTSILSDTVRVMPTDSFVHLPLVQIRYA